MHRCSSLFLFITCAILFRKALDAAPARTKLLLISFDGFPSYYLKEHTLPTFEKFIKSGVTVPYVENNFPTKTFPCHVTIATGLFSESHGIVYNSFYDPDFKETFYIKNSSIQKDPRWWKDAEPIWITAIKQGLKAGVYFWPGSETTYDGRYPDFYAPYNQSTPFTDRVDKIIDLLSKESYDLGVMYFNEPDSTGHSYGPSSSEIKQKLLEMDDLLKYILDSLKSANLESVTNVILTSDHGMVDTPSSKYLNISKDLQMDLIERIIGAHANFLVDAKPGRSSQLYQHLLELKNQFGHMTVYNRTNLPNEFHMKNNKRVPEFIVTVDEGYKIITKSNDKFLNKGDHGYIPGQSGKMYPMFAAKGPAFKKDKLSSTFKQEDIYVLMSTILNINPRPNNGSFERVKPLLLSGSFAIHPFGNFVLACNCFIVISINLFK